MIKITSTHCTIALVLTVITCGCSSGNSAIEEPREIYVSIATKNCTEELGINGNWALVNIKEEGNNHAITTPSNISLQTCNVLTTTVFNQNVSKREAFKLYRVKDYCDDYMLVFGNDSVCCMSLHGHDTMVFGDCNNREAARFYYQKIH